MRKIILLFLVLFPLFVSRAQDNNLPPLEYRRIVVGEELTATWCGYCPRGIVGMAEMKKKYPDSFIGIAVHDYSYNYDPMGLRPYADGLLGFFTSLPNILVNRQRKGDPYFNLESMYKSEMAEPVTSAVTVSVSYADEEKTMLSANVRTKFAFDAEEAQYVYAFVILENDVKGTASGYAQNNSYSGSSSPMGDFSSLPSPVPASRMVYQDVARTIFPGFDGMLSSIPGKFTKDEILSSTYDLELPLNIQNKDHIEVVVLLIDHSTGEIVNAAKAISPGMATASAHIQEPEIEVVARQEGSSLVINVKDTDAGKYSIEVYNAQGQLVKRKTMETNSPVSFVLDNSGLFFIRITDGKKTIVKKVLYRQ